MRAAKRADYRRALKKRIFRFSLKEFSAAGVTRPALEFSSPMTVICGPNGAGKTRVLKALAQTLGCAPTLGTNPLTPGEQACLRYRFEKIDCAVQFGSGESFNAEHGRVQFLVPALYAMAVLDHLHETANIPELLEAYTARELSQSDLSSLSYLINRRYDGILVYEIDDPGGTARTPVPLPYFEVTSLGRSYGSELMGLGELSVFCLWWNLARIDPGSIVLIDEPEAFTSPHSQYAFVDELMKLCARLELTIVLATQSQAIIDSVDPSAIRMLLPTDEGVIVVPSPPRPTLLGTLGMLVPKQGLLLVEDRVAALVTTTAIGLVAPEVLQLVDLVETNGTGQLQQALRMPRPGTSWFHLVGILDGDQRGSSPTGLQWPVVYIPGSRSPEEELRRVLEQHEQEAADALGRTRTDIQMALTRMAGSDGHDWLPGIATAIGVPLEQLIPALVRLWLRREEQSFRTFATEVRSQVYS